jgi:hypothetical protein
VELDDEHEPRVDAERGRPLELLDGDCRRQRVEVLGVLVAVAEARRAPWSAPSAAFGRLGDAGQPEQSQVRFGRP